MKGLFRGLGDQRLSVDILGGEEEVQVVHGNTVPRACLQLELGQARQGTGG
jgi:hypothetical protein